MLVEVVMPACLKSQHRQSGERRLVAIAGAGAGVIGFTLGARPAAQTVGAPVTVVRLVPC